MKVSCPQCQEVYNVKESLIPENGVKTRCRACEQLFQINPIETVALERLLLEEGERDEGATPAGEIQQPEAALQQESQPQQQPQPQPEEPQPESLPEPDSAPEPEPEPASEPEPVRVPESPPEREPDPFDEWEEETFGERLRELFEGWGLEKVIPLVALLLVVLLVFMLLQMESEVSPPLVMVEPLVEIEAGVETE